VEDTIRTPMVLRKDILKFLIDLRKSDPGVLPSLSDIADSLNENIDSVDDQVRILSASGALNANRTLDGDPSPFLLDAGYLLYEQLIDELATDVRDSGAAEEYSRLNFSEDYTSVVWEGKTFSFNATQALCVKILYEGFLTGVPWVSSSKISTALSDYGIYDGRMSYVFRNHGAWKSLIIFDRSGNGLYRLSISS